MTFLAQYRNLVWNLVGENPIHTGEWQSKDVSTSPMHGTYELLNQTVTYDVPPGIASLQIDVDPNLPWAENHFHERVSGEPLNPGEAYKDWPWFKGNVAEHQTIDDNQFSHTYMERFWPKTANRAPSASGHHVGDPHQGIRFGYGDLADVVDLLSQSPLTRQAYLPVWFPEDTGAVHGERVPCTIGYHFMIRDGRMHCWYFIRSCDVLRHFKDDVYLAARLMQWMCKQYNKQLGELDHDVRPGTLHMTIASLHAFTGDDFRLKKIMDNVE